MGGCEADVPHLLGARRSDFWYVYTHTHTHTHTPGGTLSSWTTIPRAECRRRSFLAPEHPHYRPSRLATCAKRGERTRSGQVANQYTLYAFNVERFVCEGVACLWKPRRVRRKK